MKKTWFKKKNVIQKKKKRDWKKGMESKRDGRKRDLICTKSVIETTEDQEIRRRVKPVAMFMQEREASAKRTQADRKEKFYVIPQEHRRNPLFKWRTEKPK